MSRNHRGCRPQRRRRPAQDRGQAGTETAPVGSLLTVEIGFPVAGGRCLARHEGRIVFVRGALPGEQAVVRVTGHGRSGAFLWAELIEVLVASPDRVTPPCPVAGVCGGCDWQHADLSAQRMLKAQVIVDALKRTGGLTEIGGVPLTEAIRVDPAGPGDLSESGDPGGLSDGLGWRTRMRYATTETGELGLRMHESHCLVEATGCPLAVSEIRATVASVSDWPVGVEVLVTASSTGELSLAIDPGDAMTEEVVGQLPDSVTILGVRGEHWVTESVAGRHWRVRADGFWQVHPAAAASLVEAVLELVHLQLGERVVDLYSGVGLFAGPMAELVGPFGRVDAVEGDADAAGYGRYNLADLPQVVHHEAEVKTWLQEQAGEQAREPVSDSVIVLDPPRAGAGLKVVDLIAARGPRAIVYLACDPVALARDLKGFASHGYQVSTIRSYDIFPMTKHVECVAVLEPQPTDLG